MKKKNPIIFTFKDGDTYVAIDFTFCVSIVKSPSMVMVRMVNNEEYKFHNTDVFDNVILAFERSKKICHGGLWSAFVNDEVTA